MDMVFLPDFVSVPKCFGEKILGRSGYKLIFIERNMRGECDCEQTFGRPAYTQSHLVDFH